MDNRTFDREFETILVALGEHRGDCTDLDRLIDVDPTELPEDQRVELERHLELCPTCSAILLPEPYDDVDDITWRRVERSMDQRDKPWLGAGGRSATTSRRQLLAVAASLLVALGGFGLWQQLKRPSDTPPSISITRGSTIQLLEPIGVVDAVQVMRWRTALPLDLTYRAEVRRGEDLVWQGETAATSLSVPADLLGALEVGIVYRWRIVGLDDEESVIAESGWTDFELGR